MNIGLKPLLFEASDDASPAASRWVSQKSNQEIDSFVDHEINWPISMMRSSHVQ
jgi:hypothetical protein